MWNCDKLHTAKKIYFVFWGHICRKKWSKSGWFQHHFSEWKHFFEMTRFFPMFLYPIRFIKVASKLNFEHCKCLIFCRQFLVSVMDKACVSDGQMHIFYEGCNRKPKTTFGLKNTGKHWKLVFVCPPIYKISGFWLVLQQFFFKQLIFWCGRYEFHHWRSYYQSISQTFILQ